MLRILIALTMPNVPNIPKTAMGSAEAMCRKLWSAKSVGVNSVCQRMPRGGRVRVPKAVANGRPSKIDGLLVDGCWLIVLAFSYLFVCGLLLAV